MELQQIKNDTDVLNMARITKSNKEVSVLIRSGHAVSDHSGSSGFNTKGNSTGLSIDDKEDEESEETEDVDEEEIDLEDTLIGMDGKRKMMEKTVICMFLSIVLVVSLKNLWRTLKQFKIWLCG